MSEKAPKSTNEGNNEPNWNLSQGVTDMDALAQYQQQLFEQEIAANELRKQEINSAIDSPQRALPSANQEAPKALDVAQTEPSKALVPYVAANEAAPASKELVPVAPSRELVPVVAEEANPAPSEDDTEPLTTAVIEAGEQQDDAESESNGGTQKDKLRDRAKRLLLGINPAIGSGILRTYSAVAERQKKMRRNISSNQVSLTKILKRVNVKSVDSHGSARQQSA